MKYKHFYRAILLRILFIVFFTALASWGWFKKDSLLVLLIAAAGVLFFLINTLRYFNNINEWISFFLQGIENEDASLKIPKNTGNKAVDEVFKGMERLNELFNKTKVDICTQEQYFRLVINQSATGLFSVNESGRIINLNPTAEKLTKLKQYHHVNTLSKINEELPAYILADSKTRKFDSVIFENQHGQKLLFKLSELITPNETIKLLAVSDITKELDTGEVDAWIKLARTLAHEIMNNITPITTLSEVLLGYFSEGSNANHDSGVDNKNIGNTIKGLELIHERSLGLMNFVENYRKFTKLPEPVLKTVNLSDLIEKEIIAAGTFSGFNHIKLEKTIPENIQAVIDAKLLSQVLTNIIKNSIEALMDTTTKNPWLHVQLKQKPDYCKIEIINNGPTIPQDIKEQIFIPFFTTKENGSGIGLSLSKQIMLKMGGDIQLKTIDNMLTSFTVTIPSV